MSKVIELANKKDYATYKDVTIEQGRQDCPVKFASLVTGRTKHIKKHSNHRLVPLF